MATSKGPAGTRGSSRTKEPPASRRPTRDERSAPTGEARRRETSPSGRGSARASSSRRARETAREREAWDSAVLFNPGFYEIASPADMRVAVEEFRLDRQASRIFTLGGSLDTVTKTMGPFDGEIRHDQTRELLATVEDVSVTVTRMTGQQGQSFLMCTLEYFVTSHGWRTGDGRMYIPGPHMTGHEPLGAPQQVLFQNSAGGTMYTWGVALNSFDVRCGDHRRYQLFHRAEHNFQGWFDSWARYTHYVHGPFFRC